MKKILLVQPSLRKNSLTALILRELYDMLNEFWDLETELFDLRGKHLEFCDEREISEYSQDIQELYQKMQESESIIFWFPVYHYAISGVLKNLLDICGEALTEKHVWVIVSAIYSDCQMAYEHFFESFEKKYNIQRLQHVPYILNSDFSDEKLGLLWKRQLEKFVKILL